MEWSGIEWNGVEWNGMEWYGMEWNGMGEVGSVMCEFMSRWCGGVVSGI